MIGTYVGHYEIREKLGEGGMGVVYRAYDHNLKREIALKALRPELAQDRNLAKRIDREVTAIASLDHPNIVALHSAPKFDGRRYLDMELVEGRSLDRVMASGELSLRDTLDIAIALADAIATAHRGNIIHRDIKPQNVVVTKQGTPKLLDFGLAFSSVSHEVAHDASTRPLTQKHAVIGSVPYMSPEQARGEKVAATSDLFSFGVLLYQAIGAQLPFTGASRTDILTSILRDDPAPLSSLRPEVSPLLEGTVGRCLAKKTADRYQSAIELRNDLTAARAQMEASTAFPWKWLATILAIALLMVMVLRPDRADNVVEPLPFPWEQSSDLASVAFLPFDDLSPDRDQGYFTEGLVTELIDLLVKVPRLRVAGQQARYHGDEDLPTIGHRMNVTHLVQGSVRKHGLSLRVTAQLIDANSGFVEWSKTYERELDDVFAVQHDIATMMTNVLELTLSGEFPAAPSTAVYDAILRARHALRLRSPENVEEAMRALETAQLHDPSSAAVWSEIGMAYAVKLQLSTDANQAQAARSQMKEALERALELDPDLATAHSRMTVLLRENWNFAAADESARRALALAPGSSVVVGNAGIQAMYAGRLDEAGRLLRRAIDLDPLNSLLHWMSANLHALAGHFSKARENIAQYYELTQRPTPFIDGLILWLEGQPRDARDAFAKMGKEPAKYVGLAAAEQALRDPKASDLALAALDSFTGDYTYQKAQAYAARGNADLAFEWLDRSYEVRDPGLTMAKVDPWLRELHADSRWSALLDRLGVSDR